MPRPILVAAVPRNRRDGEVLRDEDRARRRATRIALSRANDPRARPILFTLPRGGTATRILPDFVPEQGGRGSSYPIVGETTC